MSSAGSPGLGRFRLARYGLQRGPANMETRMSERDQLDKRDTIRDPGAAAGGGNTLRGLNKGAPGADEGSASSGMGVVVPSIREPAPVEATREPIVLENRPDYFPPEEPPNRTEHKTFELQTVKVDPYADPRTAP